MFKLYISWEFHGIFSGFPLERCFCLVSLKTNLCKSCSVKDYIHMYVLLVCFICSCFLYALSEKAEQVIDSLVLHKMYFYLAVNSELFLDSLC